MLRGRVRPPRRSTRPSSSPSVGSVCERTRGFEPRRQPRRRRRDGNRHGRDSLWRFLARRGAVPVGGGGRVGGRVGRDVGRDVGRTRDDRVQPTTRTRAPPPPPPPPPPRDGNSDSSAMPMSLLPVLCACPRPVRGGGRSACPPGPRPAAVASSSAAARDRGPGAAVGEASARCRAAVGGSVGASAATRDAAANDESQCLREGVEDRARCDGPGRSRSRRAWIVSCRASGHFRTGGGRRRAPASTPHTRL